MTVRSPVAPAPLLTLPMPAAEPPAPTPARTPLAASPGAPVAPFATAAPVAPVASVVLRAEHLGRRFGSQVALVDVSLTVERGEVLTVVGPSGCGKTTLLRIVCGLDRPDGGRLELAGRCVADADTFVPAHRRTVGYVPQDVALFPDRSVADNVAFGLRRRLGRTGRTRRVAEVLELVRLGHLAHRYPHELSGGEQQRAAIARALAPDPDLVCLDEPFSALDPQLRRDVGEDIVELLRTAGATALLVTHDQDEALGLGDRVAVLVAGSLAWCGTTERAFDQTESAVAARFLGATDSVRGTVTDDGVVTALGTVAAPPGAAGGTAVSVAVRPSDTEIVGGPTANAVVRRVRLGRSGPVAVVDLDAGDTVQVRTASGAVVAGDRVHVRLAPHAHPAVS